ncbi:MAG TPA: hypothetical protein VG247_20845 [Pseudonocardiaceae bacterium]|jgi:hypothetical protein|nr:hypothetical protein [Pseudonocardiaceae bacterium]
MEPRSAGALAGSASRSKIAVRMSWMTSCSWSPGSLAFGLPQCQRGLVSEGGDHLHVMILEDR